MVIGDKPKQCSFFIWSNDVSNYAQNTISNCKHYTQRKLLFDDDFVLNSPTAKHENIITSTETTGVYAFVQKSITECGNEKFKWKFSISVSKFFKLKYFRFISWMAQSKFVFNLKRLTTSLIRWNFRFLFQFE